MPSNLRFVTIKDSIGADGIGIPTVSIYFSYCDKKDISGEFCKGCHNVDLQKDGVGVHLNYSQICMVMDQKLSFLQAMYGPKVEIAFIGGEPFADINKQMCVQLAKYYHTKGVRTIVYTWRNYSEVQEAVGTDVKYFNRIVCGPYLQELAVEGYALGSSNQYIVDGITGNQVLTYNGGTA